MAHSIATSHPFIDGNKRTALGATLVTLRLNGYQLDATGAEEEQAVMDLVLGCTTLEDFAKWLKDHAVPVGLDS